MTHQHAMEISDYVAELTRPHIHREPYTVRLGATSYTQQHATKVPALLLQLRYASPSGQGEERGGGGYESRPAASVDAVATLYDIDQEAARWVKKLGEDDAGDTLACVRMLNALAAGLVRCRKPSKQCCDFHRLERDVRHWWTQARVMTGWDSPAWRPDNTCPMCAERGSLRIKLIDQVGLCVECKESWTRETIGLLAEHIRLESAAERPARAQLVCWCPWPRPAVETWPSLCPSCASPWCQRAGWSAALAGLDAAPDHAWSVPMDGPRPTSRPRLEADRPEPVDQDRWGGRLMAFYSECPECKSTNIIEHQDGDLWVESCGACGITLSDTWIGEDDAGERRAETRVTHTKVFTELSVGPMRAAKLAIPVTLQPGEVLVVPLTLPLTES